jgi:hypothetical protein
MAKKLTGGGSNKFVQPGIRTGLGSKGSSPGAADQIGQSTAFKKESVDAGPAYNPTKYGNEIALNSKSAPGQGRTIHPCGSQGLQGPVAGQQRPQGADILSAFGPEQPLTFCVRFGAYRGDVMTALKAQATKARV